MSDAVNSAGIPVVVIETLTEAPLPVALVATAPVPVIQTTPVMVIAVDPLPVAQTTTLPVVIAAPAIIKSVTSGVITDETNVHRQIRRNFLDIATTAVTPVIAAQGEGMTVRVISMTMAAGATTSATFFSNGIQISPEMRVAPGGPIIFPESVHGYLEGFNNHSLDVFTSTSAHMGIILTWFRSAVVPTPYWGFPLTNFTEGEL